MPNDEFMALRDGLAAIPAPTLRLDDNPVTVEDFGTRLDEALLVAQRVERLAKSPANNLDGALSQALAVHIAAGDAQSAFGVLKDAVAAMEDGWKSASATARRLLAVAMDQTGAPDTETETHTATSTEGLDNLVIENEKLLPLDCVETVSKPNNKIIKARLISNLLVPGARLDKGPPGVRVSAKKVKRGGAA